MRRVFSGGLTLLYIGPGGLSAPPTASLLLSTTTVGADAAGVRCCKRQTTPFFCRVRTQSLPMVAFHASAIKKRNIVAASEEDELPEPAETLFRAGGEYVMIL